MTQTRRTDGRERHDVLADMAFRPGRPPKIDNDPALLAFAAARIAEDVARHFPPERRAGKSAIHQWWRAGAHRHSR